MFDSSNIILGFTGSIGSGCTYISERISDLSGGQYSYFKLSDIIRKELSEDGIDKPSVEQMQEKGNALRSEHGQAVLAVKLIETILESKEEYEHIIVDGIKNDGEVAFFRQLPNFYLFSINADRDVRKSRSVGAGRPFGNDEDFINADKRDEKEVSANGQQVKKCNHISDIIIVNNKTYADADTHGRDDWINGIRKKYIELIENNLSGEMSPQSSPSVNELCMTMAFALSKKSSCLKRKVGSIIIDSSELSATDHEPPVAQTLPHVIASGYNEVPAGQKKCIFNEEYQRCYRDYLQEVQAEKIKFCPSCGTQVEAKMSCPHCGQEYEQHVKFCKTCHREIKESYECSDCSTKVFEEYLPGSKNTPGKLLDLCRALHAEEMAIMQLSKSGGNRTGNLVLFATTQPCNLCANKIATAGIAKVVYAEPYDMAEAKEILRQGNVQLERFEGVKSSAYFKLYN